jgi:CRP-like cAMP-binding protein
MFEILVKCPLFIGLNSDEIAVLLKTVHHQVKTFQKNELIAQSDEKINAQLIVVEGSVKGEMMDFTGKTIKIEDIESPRPLAPAFLFGQMNRFPVNIVANEKVSILFIPKTSFMQMMRLNENVLGNFLSIISNRAQFLSGKIKFLSFQSIKGKLAHYLLQQSKRDGSFDLVLEKSQNQLAELFGVTRPSLGRAIREMDKAKLIEARARKVKILDKQGLSALLK